MTYSDLSKETGLSDSNLRSIEKELLTEKIKNREIKEIKTIGIDEIQSGHGHQYSHIVTDLGNEEVLFVGDGRKSVDLAPFLLKYRRFLPKVEFVVMDMWQGFIKVFRRFTPDAKIIHDHFHISKHLNEALNEVRIEEYKKIATEDRKYIKGRKWLLLSRRSNLSLLGRNSLRELFRINKRIMKAYLLKEQFRKIWGYESKAWALKFWLSWKNSLRWQRLAPLVKFAGLFDAHLDGIMNFYDHKGTLKMGYIEGFNNKVKTLIRRHYGFRDKEFLKLKIIQIGSASLKDYVPYPWFSTE
jgi:transposase